MQQGQTFMDWHKGGVPVPPVNRPRLVTAGATVLLLGVACLILGVFAGLGPGSEEAAAAPPAAAPVTDPLARDPLTSGLPEPTAVATPIARPVARKRAPAAPAATAPVPATTAPSDQGSGTRTDGRRCRLPWGGYDSNGSWGPGGSWGSNDTWRSGGSWGSSGSWGSGDRDRRRVASQSSSDREQAAEAASAGGDRCRYRSRSVEEGASGNQQPAYRWWGSS